MSKKRDTNQNLPSVSKQTAGGITGAVIGGMVAGPVGAVAGGIAGALVGDSSAKGNEPIHNALKTIRSTGKRGAKAIKAARDRGKSASAKKQPTPKAASKTALVGQKRKAEPATRKPVKVASKPKTRRAQKSTKKKA